MIWANLRERSKQVSKPVYEYDNTAIEIVVDEFSAEYHTCGSHQILLTVKMDMDSINNMLEQFGMGPLTPDASFPPEEQTNED